MPGVPACPVCNHNFDAGFDYTNTDMAAIYRCEADHGGGGPLSYQAAEAPVSGAGTSSGGTKAKTVKLDERKTDDLLVPLLTCLRAEDGWTEFGVIEYRLSREFRGVFARHVQERGHVMFGSTQHLDGSASGNRVSMALRRLWAAGHLVKKDQPSTGDAWKQTSPISYWALAPVEDGAPTLTWAAFCETLGRSTGWTPEDRSGLASPLQGVDA